MKETILDHWQKAEDYIASQGYDLLRFVKYENGCEIYNYTCVSMLGKKTGWPHFISVDGDGNITDIDDLDELIRLRGEFCKQITRKEKSFSNIKDLTGKTIFDFATNEEILELGIAEDEIQYKEHLSEKNRVVDLLNLSEEFGYRGLERRVKRLYPEIIKKYASFNE